MTTPEGRVKAKVKKALEQLGDQCWRFMPVQSGYGTVALDFLLAIRGRFVAIETKAPGKKLTPLQESTKAAIEAAGGLVFVVWDESSLEIAMKIILALEFAPYVAGSVQQGLDAVYGTSSPREIYPVLVGSEDEERFEKHLRTLKQREEADAATRRDHGAPGEQPERQPEQGARRSHQPVTATVTTGPQGHSCPCGFHGDDFCRQIGCPRN